MGCNVLTRLSKLLFSNNWPRLWSLSASQNPGFIMGLFINLENWNVTVQQEKYTKWSEITDQSLLVCSSTFLSVPLVFRGQRRRAEWIFPLILSPIRREFSSLTGRSLGEELRGLKGYPHWIMYSVLALGTAAGFNSWCVSFVCPVAVTSRSQTVLTLLHALWWDSDLHCGGSR